MYLKDGQPFDIDVTHQIDDVQYPPPWFGDADNRAAFGIVPAIDTPPPAVSATQRAVADSYEQGEDGTWSTRWAVVDKTAEELAEEAAAAAPKVPQQVTMRQARLALLDAGLLSQVDAAIDSLSSPEKEAARIEWDYSSTVERNRSLVTMLGAALGLDTAGLDALFIAASGK